LVKIVQINVKGFDNNFSYLLIGKNNESFLIDATGSKEEIEKTILKNKVVLVAQLLTHNHPDHCELIPYFESKGAKLINFKEIENVPFAEKVVEIAGVKVRAIFTPGHLNDAKCFIIENNIFSGDTLFVRGIGTTAYGGNDALLKKTLEYLRTFNPKMILWPGHDYGGTTSTLKQALDNSHIKPGKKARDNIKKKVGEYEKVRGKKY